MKKSLKEKAKQNTKKQNPKARKVKALVLLSGGLDSRLACRIMQEQAGKDNMEALLFLLPFGEGCCADKYCVFRFCQKEGIKLRVIDCTKGKLLVEYLDLIRSPRYGYGAGINPCIDCRIFMFKKAKEIMEKDGFDIIATGEVIGERPMSQRKKAMDIIENKSGLKGKLLRPLSAKLLPETELERLKLLDREGFFDIQGRQRKKQIELAKKYKIDYPSPAGGCLLCEKELTERIKTFLENENKISEGDIKLLKIGRQFYNGKIILGRNEKENKEIELIAKEAKIKGILLIPQQPGPSAFVKDAKDNKNNKELIEKAKELIQKYSKHEIKEIKIIESKK